MNWSRAFLSSSPSLFSCLVLLLFGRNAPYGERLVDNPGGEVDGFCWPFPRGEVLGPPVARRYRALSLAGIRFSHVFCAIIGNVLVFS